MAQSPRSLPMPDFQTLFESAPHLNLVLAADLMIVAVSDVYPEFAVARYTDQYMPINQ
jgi:hypothetical protein